MIDFRDQKQVEDFSKDTDGMSALIARRNAAQITAVISSGKNAGKVMKPWVEKETGMYVVSHTRFCATYIRVATLHEVLLMVDYGFSVRMQWEKASPSLISPQSLTIKLPSGQ